jgi:hypothetical protein
MPDNSRTRTCMAANKQNVQICAIRHEMIFAGHNTDRRILARQ